MIHKYLSNVVTLSLDPVKCTGCGMCTQVCPHNVFQVEDKKALIVNKDLCIECGACARNCSLGAITVTVGVGCAAAVINSKLSGSTECCC